MQNVALVQMNSSVHGAGRMSVMRSKKWAWFYEDQGAAAALEDVCQGFLRRMEKGCGGSAWWGGEIRRLCLVTSAPQGKQTSKSLKIQIPSPGKFILFDPND